MITKLGIFVYYKKYIYFEAIHLSFNSLSRYGALVKNMLIFFEICIEQFGCESIALETKKV